MPTLVYDRTRLNTAVVTVYRRILTEYLAQYYDRGSPCRLRRDTTISGYKRSLFLKHHCTRSAVHFVRNRSYTIQNDQLLSQ